jgi:hypothetical protein
MPVAVDNKRGISYLKFGNADVQVGSYKNGSDEGILISVEDFPRVFMKFENEKSIDAVIDMLIRHKRDKFSKQQ